MKRFPDKARVCFVGDSITKNGTYIKYILDNYRRMFPGANVEFYNCGISGGNLGNTIAVYERDVAIYDPTHIVLMIGVNDSRRNILETERSPERYALLVEAYRQYGENLERFFQMTKERGIELTLCTPMPYAEYMDSDEVPLRAGYALIQGYAALVRDFAQAHGLALCDYHSAATEYMQGGNLYNSDRVHPTARGHELMAKTFLATQGIELQGPESFSDEIEEWYDKTQRLRKIITAEYLLVGGYVDMSDSERIAALNKFYDEVEAGTFTLGAYHESLIRAYPENKPHEAELIEWLMRFMKGEN